MDIVRNEFLIDSGNVRLQRKLPKLEENEVSCVFETCPAYLTKVKKKYLSPGRRSHAKRSEPPPTQIEVLCSTETYNIRAGMYFSFIHLNVPA